MSHSTRIAAALTRVGVEMKSIRASIATKYTKPGAGIPLGDLSASVQADLAPLSPPGVPGSNVLGGVKNPDGQLIADHNLPSYVYAQIGVDPDGVMSSSTLQSLLKWYYFLRSGEGMDGEAVFDEDLIGNVGLQEEVKKTLKAGRRWEQEILVMAGTRVTGLGSAPLGLHVPYAVRIKGIKYDFETVTTSGSTLGDFNVNSVSQGEAALNVQANSYMQIVSGIDIAVPAGSRIGLQVNSIGAGTTGKGLYMSVWGEYDLNGVALP